MGKIKKLGDMAVRITCSCGNMHELEQMEDGTLTYDEIHVRKDEPPSDPKPKPKADEPPSDPKPPVEVPKPRGEKYRYTGLFKRERS